MMNPRRRQIRYALLSLICLLILAFGGCAEGELDTTENSDNDDIRPSNQNDRDAGDEADAHHNQGGDDGGHSDDTDPNGGQNGTNDSCQATEQCASDEVCARTAPGADGACEIPTQERLAGEDCTDPAQCETGLCYEGRCTSECTAPGDCLDGWACPDDGDGGACAPPPCASDDDCQGTQACGLTQGGDALETVCLPDNGGAPSGQSCGEHRDCVSRYCDDETCSAFCTDLEPCDGSQSCGEGPISVGGQEGVFEHCQPVGVTACIGPADCPESDMTCNLPTFDAQGEMDGASCGFTNPGQADVGSSCAAASQCESGLCLPTYDGDSGECSVFCQNPAPDCGADQHCMRIDEELSICVGDCTRNQDCSGGNYCHVGIDTNDQIQTFCEHPVGDLETGEECTESSQCASSFCLATFATYDINCVGDSQCPGEAECTCPPNNPGCAQNTCVLVEERCSELCDAANGDADCTAGTHPMTRCDDVQLEVDGDVEVIQACSYDFD